MTTQALADGWTVQYDDRFARKLRHESGDRIKLHYPNPDGRDRSGTIGRHEYEVVGRLGETIYHESFEYEDDAFRYVAVLMDLAEWEPTYEAGDEVYVMSEGFDPVVQCGTVGADPDEYRSIPVYVSEGDDGRTIRAQEDEIIHVHAGTVETLVFIDRTDLLEPDDFAERHQPSDFGGDDD